MDAATADLEKRAKSGDVTAQLALGRHYESEGDTRSARNWLAHAAKAGDPEAARALAINLMTREPIAGDVAIHILGDAAQRGDAEAMHLCGMIAAQDEGLPRHFEIALDHIRDAAARGHALARAELRLLAGARSSEDWTALRDRIDPAALSSPLAWHEISKAPRIGVIENCAPAEVCDWLIAQAGPRLGRAQVYDPGTGLGRHEGARSNSSTQFDLLQSDIVLLLLRARIAASAGLPLANLEPAQVLHYTVGQEFKTHFDFLDLSVPGYARSAATHGQRVATFLLYLNDDYDGGETEFPEVRIRHKGRKGDGLLFWNVGEDGEPDKLTLHAGTPPARGEKWVLSQWLRRPLHQLATPARR
jgi:prolyl 4-hydroxylase